jgi:hypothetical protein
VNAKQLVYARQCSQPAGLECLLQHGVRDVPLPKTPEGAIMLTIHPESGEFGLTDLTWCPSSGVLER